MGELREWVCGFSGGGTSCRGDVAGLRSLSRYGRINLYVIQRHTLSLKSSTILLMGGSRPDPLDCRVCEDSTGWAGFLSDPGGNLRVKLGWTVPISGVASGDSSRAAVAGRNREAITTRLFLRLDIVLDDEDKGEDDSCTKG